MNPLLGGSTLDSPPSDNANSSTKPQDNGYRYDTFAQRNVSTTAHHPPSHPQPGDPEATAAAAALKPGTRALAPDLLRGLLMVIMALDHVAVMFHTWEHGTGRKGENDGAVVSHWNKPVAYVVRTLTHLCGSGFTFLMGMGVVYLSQSRTDKLGWSALRLTRYYATRAAVLTAVTILMGSVFTGGKVWFLNMVLFALAVDYFLAGLLWLVIDRTEGVLTRLLVTKVLARGGKTPSSTYSDGGDGDDYDDDDEGAGVARPLLPGRVDRADGRELLAATISWHAHNAVLVVLSLITIFWNIWLSEDNGHCKTHTSTNQTSTATATATQSPLLRIWFWPVMEGGIMSGFPPMAWLSFAILGLLYGRIMMAKPWTRATSAAGHISAGLLFLLFFVLTRVLHFGNLSEGCLRTPEHAEHPERNQYLASPASFFYIIKYPPDVAYWALTMAGNLFLLAGFGAIPKRIAARFTMLLDFGTTALFFYVVHMGVIFALSLILIPLIGVDTGLPDEMHPGAGTAQGILNIPLYFALWFVVLLIMWPICRRYSRFKSTKHPDSLWRFF